MSALSCREVVELLAGYLDEELSAPQCLAFEEHLSECEKCVLYVQQYREIIRLARRALDGSDDEPF